jgi:hypothetical protein
MRWTKILTVLLICIVGLRAVWALAYPTSKHRFRLTVNVETPTGLKSGSSVMETVVERQPAIFALKSGGHMAYPSLDGEAVFVDLGSTPDGKSLNLIVLLAWGPAGTGADFAAIPRLAFNDYLQANQDARNGLWRQNHWKGPKDKTAAIGCGDEGDFYCELAQLPIGSMREVRGGLIPTLITLTNPDDPKGAKVVGPDALQETFGLGFQLRNVTLEFVTPGSWPLSMFGMSGEPLTHEIEGRLPKIFEAFRSQPQPSYFEKIGDPFILRRQQLKLEL